MGIIILLTLAAIEVFFLVWRIVTKERHAAEKAVVTLATSAIFIVLTLTGVIEWSFRYYELAAMLLVLTILAAVTLIRKKEKPYKLSRSILSFVGKTMLLMFVITPAIIFPQYALPTQSGSCTVATESRVFVDESRAEAFSASGANRAVTVDFYYPQDADGKLPLVVFSHGAFGFSGSNDSACRELASNGYLVAAINHPYHAFFDTEAYGTLVTVNPEVIGKALYYNGKEPTDEEFADSHEWLQLRVEDMNFVVDTLKEKAADSSDKLLSHIDTEKIGLFGHSLGGAASVELGRERDDIDAVIDIDGTMIGEELAFEDGRLIVNETPYPVAMLDIFAENHYNGAQKYADMYPNILIESYSDTVTTVVLRGAGHLNVTDLPLFSPVLASMLGIGDTDARECIETTNTLIREFFDWQLKGAENPQFEEEYLK